MVAILGYSREQIFEAVTDMYTAVAEDPAGPYHFPLGEAVGRALGYPDDDLAALPATLRASFAGVGNPFKANAVRPGDTVLDLGAGAGVDSLVAARRAGPAGHVVALDRTPAMNHKLKTGAERANVSVVRGCAEALPFADASIDSVTSNGALNLVPDKRRAVMELFRVLRPGGRLQLADVVIHCPVTADCSEDPRLWVECVVGATVDEELLALFREAGFEDIKEVGTHDYFALSPSAQTRDIAASFGARSVELAMCRGERTPTRLERWRHRLDPRRLLRRLWRRGFLGVVGLGLALTACYGTLATVALLAALGVGRIALAPAPWAVAIAAFTGLTAAAVAAGIRRHRAYGPAALAALGAIAVFFALFVHYRLWIEAGGFALLAIAVLLDIRLRRREQGRVLGLSRAGVPTRRPGN